MVNVLQKNQAKFYLLRIFYEAKENGIKVLELEEIISKFKYYSGKQDMDYEKLKNLVLVHLFLMKNNNLIKAVIKGKYKLNEEARSNKFWKNGIERPRNRVLYIYEKLTETATRRSW